MKKDGSAFAVIHDFGGGNVDGYQPNVEPLEGSDGRLYVVTRGGGADNAGAVCALNKSGSGFFVLHPLSAAGTNDGRLPNGPAGPGAHGDLDRSTGSGGTGGGGGFFSGFG